MSMPFYVSPEQQMRDRASYAQQGVARARSSVTLQYADGILLATPNSSNALHKISELYDKIAFAAVGRYNEYENLRKAGVTYADIMGYQYDRNDVTARGIANYYAGQLGQIFIESNKPFEVEVLVAEVGDEPEADELYRITFDGLVTDEHGYVAMGGDVAKVSAVLKDRYSAGMTLAQAFGAALAALASLTGPAGGNGSTPELTAGQLEVAVLDRNRDHRKFRRIRGSRLEELAAEARSAGATPAGSAEGEAASGSTDPEPPAAS